MSENNIVNSNADTQESPAVEQATSVAQATTEATAKPKAPVYVQTAHDDFDWSIDKRNVAAYTKDEKEKYDKVYDGTFVAITDGELVKGLVVGVTKTDVVVNIGFKSDGLVSLNEFRDLANLRTGDEGEVMVVKKKTREGPLHFSAKHARVP